MLSSLPRHSIVLLGIGHTNAHVLRMWRMRPLRDARLTCVSHFAEATYSGMLPGTLAGLYPPGRMQIDLVRLCAAAGARLILSEVTALEAENRLLHFADRPPLPFDVLSIGIGSAPRRDGARITGDAVLPIKPMQTFLARLDERLCALGERVAGRPLRIAIVGGGAGGVEIAFCLPFHLRKTHGGLPHELLLVDGGPRLAAGLPPRTGEVARRELESRGVRVLLGQGVREVAADRLAFDDGREEPVDLVLWSTGAAAPPELARWGLPTDAAGFLIRRPTLQVAADAPIFAVGDAASCPEGPLPKAGVYAVRQGPVLWDNLGRMLRGEELAEYKPQRGFLSLLATGDRRAILSYKGLTFHGRWCWRLKDRIDGRFMDMYQDYSPAMAGADASSLGGDAAHGKSPASRPAMRCTGCGGKVGAGVLARALARLEIPPSPHVLLGLEAPDDAAIVRPVDGRPIVVTADFFASFLDDPYLVGRVAALNAASDLFATGARPLAALALATLPLGPPKEQEQLLYELLAGGLHELRKMGATLVGGHTIEGPQMTIGYSMLADAGTSLPRTKSRLRPGDVLVLTKPLGSGVLLAAHAQARCRAAWFLALLPVLLESNQAAAELCEEFDIAAVTDVTGFGLAGHLLEMLRASHASAELRLEDVPLLPGVAELVAEGIASTLAPANRAAEAEMAASEERRRAARYAALFDPQTSGGLLLGVAESRVEDLLRRLAELSDVPAAAIGRVAAPREGSPRLVVR